MSTNILIGVFITILTVTAVIVEYLSILSESARLDKLERISNMSIDGISLGTKFYGGKAYRDPRLHKYDYEFTFTLTKENVVNKMELIVYNVSESDVDDILSLIDFDTKLIDCTVYDSDKSISLTFESNLIGGEGLTKKTYIRESPQKNLL